ncbi:MULTISPECIES: phage integrase family protein [Burkholderia]|jgi:hypothetical protein|uniref:Integrase n=1 Tax=Burkholderia contaminans TaxID=488447 RepID=A0AAP1V552_9BURK|nr:MULTISPECIES: phage integrase family protein [Burkholderia]UTP26654.1 integrase [Burkholderia sp. FXe9]MBA9831772.1 integrase [Burkholderia contaminans]MBA9842439.1 integrase [Burkholderia contaminans]MBA9864936.1 integrase [Burkholderia contaminans]MBA9908029.1 integrase [Burkholderia contaminans]
MPVLPDSLSFPDAASLAVLRTWYASVGSREAVERYCPDQLGEGKSARGVTGRIRRKLVEFAISRHRDALAKLFQCEAGERIRHRKAVARAVAALHTNGIRTLAELIVRISRRRRWWLGIPSLGERSAHRVEAFFAACSALTERARSLVVATTPESVTPWENIRVPHDVDGSRGIFRAPKAMCARSQSGGTVRRTPGS